MVSKAEINKLDYESIKDNLKIAEVGFKGSPTWVENIVVPEKIERKGKIYNNQEKEDALRDIEEILIEKNLMGVE